MNNLLLQVEGSIATLTINRPQQLNALNGPTINELHQSLKELQANEAVRLVILTGSGEKAFVAGADIKEFANYSPSEGSDMAAQGQKKLFDFIENLGKPVIAAINGFALGGGLELAMACHLRLAAENAKMGLPEVGLGLIPGYGGTQRLAELVGKGRAMEMILTARMIDAQRAYEIGLVNQVVAGSDLLAAAKEMAQSILKNAPSALHSAMKAVNAGYKDGLSGYRVEIEEFGSCFGTADFKEGTQAFLEKRKPQF